MRAEKESIDGKEDRKVTHNLTVQYNQRLYLLEDSIQNRKLRRRELVFMIMMLGVGQEQLQINTSTLYLENDTNQQKEANYGK